MQRLSDALDDHWNDEGTDDPNVRALSEAEFARLMQTGYLERWTDGEISVDEVASAIELIRLSAGGHTGNSKRRNKTDDVPDLKAEAFAEIACLEAGRAPDVVAFRRDVLADVLLEVAAIPDWVAAVAETDGPATSFVRIPADAETLPRSVADVIADGPTNRSRDVLRYPGAGDWAVPIPVRSGGILDRLRRASLKLSRAWGWSEALASGFILTGLSVPAIRGRVTVGIKMPYPARSTVTIEVVAGSVTKSEIANLYAEAVDDSGLAAGAGGGRRMSEKGARLAVAAAVHAHAERTWAASMRIWNDDNDEMWSYTDVKRFAGDARVRFKRVTGQPLPTGQTPSRMETTK